MRRVLPWVAAVALVAVLVIGFTQAGGEDSASRANGPSLDEAQRALAGSPGPLAALHRRAGELTKSDRAGYAKELRALRGHPVVVNAWASWCGPCKLEFPIFQKVSTRLGKRVGFVGLNVSDNVGDARAFLRREPVPYPHLVDGDSRVIQAEAHAGGLPVTLFYDKAGRRRFVHQGGYRSEADLVADIRRYTR